MFELSAEKTMTVKEIAAALEVSVELITKKAKELYPEKIRNGHTSYFNEIEVTEIKNNLVKKYEVETKEDKKQILKRAFEILNDENEELRQKILEDAPKIETYNSFLSADNWMTMNNVAHTIGVGRNGLFKVLRDKKILMKDNTPYQKYMESGYFKVVVKTVDIGKDKENVPQTFVSSKGIEFIRNKLNEQE